MLWGMLSFAPDARGVCGTCSDALANLELQYAVVAVGDEWGRYAS